MSAMYQYSENFIRRIVHKYKDYNWQSIFLWEELPEKQREKILSNKWLPDGIKPILAGPNGVKKGFVLCDDNVFYSRGVHFPDDKLSIAGLVGCDAGEGILTYADGTEIKLPRVSHWCEDWLWRFLKAVAENNPGHYQRDFAPLAEESDFLKRLGEDHLYYIMSDPKFLTADEMPEYLIAKLHRSFPEIELSDVRGFCDLPKRRDHCIVLTMNRVYYRGDYGTGCVDLNLWRSHFFTDPESGKIVFMGGVNTTEKDERLVSVGDRLFRMVEEQVEYQYSRTATNTFFGTMKTERMTPEKAKFMYHVRRLLWEKEWNEPHDANELLPKLQLFQINLDSVCGYFEDMVAKYEWFHKSLSPKTDLRLWAYTGFMCAFYRPLTTNSLKWMLYYLLQLERNCIIAYRYFFGQDGKWLEYYFGGKRWEVSLITQRNDLARRFNEQAAADGWAEAPLLDGYVLDDCLARGRKKY